MELPRRYIRPPSLGAWYWSSLPAGAGGPVLRRVHCIHNTKTDPLMYRRMKIEEAEGLSVGVTVR